MIERRQYYDDEAAHDAGVGVTGKVPATVLTFLRLQPGLALASLEAKLLLLPLGRQGGQQLAELDDEPVLVLPAVGGGKLLAQVIGIRLPAYGGIAFEGIHVRHALKEIFQSVQGRQQGIHVVPVVVAGQ
ncbi:hypothetical protein D3C78_1533560 [compost metagenome]